MELVLLFLGGTVDPSPTPTPENSEIVEGLNVLNDTLIDTNNSIKEQTEVQKNIFQKLLDIPGQILEGFLNLLKSVFIPSDDFLSNYFDELFGWFTDRLGFISYPFELIVDILNKILSINFGEPIISIPDIQEPVTNELLVKGTSLNLNMFLENKILKNIHDIYLIIIDSIIIFALVNLAKNKFEEVTRS